MAKKSNSRPARWAAAVAKLSTGLDDVEAAIEDLRGLQEEYESWKGNLPESLQSSPVGVKLEAVCDLDLSNGADDLRGICDEAEGMDLPIGFGKD